MNLKVRIVLIAVLVCQAAVAVGSTVNLMRQWSGHGLGTALCADTAARVRLALGPTAAIHEGIERVVPPGSLIAVRLPRAHEASLADLPRLAVIGPLRHLLYPDRVLQDVPDPIVSAEQFAAGQQRRERGEREAVWLLVFEPPGAADAPATDRSPAGRDGWTLAAEEREKGRWQLWRFRRD